MKFLTPLITQKHVEPGEFVIYQDFQFELEHDGHPWRVTVPAGFITDFASIPRLAQLLPGFGVNDASANAAVAHDWLYCCGGRVAVANAVSGEIRLLTLTRQEVDRLFYIGLLASGYRRTQAALFYSAVRIGGWIYWRRRASGIDPTYDFVPLDHWSKP